jgi:hypothetical protein
MYYEIGVDENTYITSSLIPCMLRIGCKPIILIT